MLRNFLLVSSLCFPFSVQAGPEPGCAATIGNIKTQGNEVTGHDYLIKWSGLEENQQLDDDSLDNARQKLFDTDLFREVSITADDICRPEITVTITVLEKRYHLIYPRLSRNGDGDIDMGLKYTGHNLFGADHTVNITVSQKDYSNGDTAERLKMDYDWPMSIKPYHVRWAFHSIDTLLSETTENVTESDKALSFLVGRDWFSSHFDQPVTVFARVELWEKSIDGNSPELTLEPGQYNTLGIRLEYDNVHYERYRRFGYYYGLELNRGINELGSDFNSAHFIVEARYYYRLDELDNINSRFIISLASDKIFNEYNYSMGGHNTLRAIKTDSIFGNGLWQANIEYIKGFPGWPSVRIALFTDIGNVFESYSSINDHDWLQTYGLGLRWKIRSFVKTDLVIDYAYDPDSEYSKIYAGTSLVF